MTWNDGANVCGSGAAAAQPLTRADCETAGISGMTGGTFAASLLRLPPLPAP